MTKIQTTSRVESPRVVLIDKDSDMLASICIHESDSLTCEPDPLCKIWTSSKRKVMFVLWQFEVTWHRAGGWSRLGSNSGSCLDMLGRWEQIENVWLYFVELQLNRKQHLSTGSWFLCKNNKSARSGLNGKPRVIESNFRRLIGGLYLISLNDLQI